MKTNQLQCCVITLSDGSNHTFIGKAVFKKGEKRTIANIHFTYPEQLPNGVIWETMEAPKAGSPLTPAQRV